MQNQIYILYTGGTIGMGPSDILDLNSSLVPKSWEELKAFLPAVQSDGYFKKHKNLTIHFESLENIKDSSQVTLSDWQLMASKIEANYNNYDGFIIIHGTDTMAFTASALSFMLINLTKPVVLTGSQLPISHPRTDASINLSNAIHIAASASLGLPIVPEVVIVFNDKIHRGNRCTKFSTRDFEGFDSPNFYELGELEESITVKVDKLLQPSNNPFGLKKKLNNKIIDLAIFPGFRVDHIEELVRNKKLDGLVIQTYGAGNAPCSDAFINLLKVAKENETYVLFITQCHNGGVNLGKYAPSKRFLEMGVISGGDMTNEAALTKMMWVLGNYEKPADIRQVLAESVSGERSY